MMRIARFATAALALSACGEAERSDDQAPAAEVEILPPDETMPISANQSEPALMDKSMSGQLGNAPATVPTALHGRWGLTPEDCDSDRSDAKGMVTITAESLRFYESIALPLSVAERSERMIRGNFAFNGEGMRWHSPMIWSVDGNRLTRIDSEGDSRLVYIRC